MKNTPQTTTTASIKKKPKTGYIKWIVIAAIVLELPLNQGDEVAQGGSVAMDWTISLVAIGFCAVIGVLFGGYPAAKASRLQPIDALHTT